MRKKRAILIIGGARSGKSRCALELTRGFKAKTLLATLEPKDREMKARIRNHRLARGPGWKVIEEPLKLAQALESALLESEAVVVDCITLWLTNLLLAGKKENDILQELEKICRLVARPPCLVVMVSNEVGMGIVPAHKLTRRFRDLQGQANQMLASRCREVILMQAGIPLWLKGKS